MRVILAALFCCLVACLVSSAADAKVRHHHRHYAAHHHSHYAHAHRVHPAVRMISVGLAHVLRDAQSAQADAGWPTGDTMGALYWGARSTDGFGWASWQTGVAAAANIPVKATGAAIRFTDTIVAEPIRHFAHDPRPAAWCGWYMRRLKGVADRAYNVAANWAHWGRPAMAPAPGVVVVWPHHVGELVAYAGHGVWLVKSGNDGHAVRTRPRTLAGVIALRWG